MARDPDRLELSMKGTDAEASISSLSDSGRVLKVRAYNLILEIAGYRVQG